jgi:hypothetical protein
MQANQDASNRKLIGFVYCKQYQADAKFYIRTGDEGRELRVVYDSDRPEFGSEIPESWTEQDVLDLISWPMKDRNARHPAWEVPARVYGSWSLFRWWAGEKPE